MEETEEIKPPVFVNVTYNDVCQNGLLLPIIPHEASWNTGFRAFIYLFGLLYCFLGVAIVADVFMSSIEKITSKTKKLYLSMAKEGEEPEFLEVRIWNDTVANLTLMALGSSAPEILLSCIEIVGNGFEAGDLGPGTIVGSAAFNLLAISAVCVIGIPNGEVRTVRLIKVFFVTSGFSMFAYLWLYMVLELITPDYIDSWEAVLTFLFFPLMVLIAWWADRDWKIGKRNPVSVEQQIELGMPNGRPGAETMLEKQKKLFTAEGEVNREALVEFYKELRKYPDLSDSDAAVLAATKLIDSQPHSRLWYRIGAVRGIAGSRKIHPILSDKLREVYDAVNSHPDVPDLGQVPALVADHSHLSNKAIVEFHTASFAVLENVGNFNVTVVRHGRMDNTIRVRVESFDGTAKAGSDYVQINEQLVFGPYAKEREVAVTIIDDNQWEPDEEFFLRLSIIDDGIDKRDVVLGRLPIMEIVILNDDNPGVLQFKKRGILVKESCNFVSVEVERVNGADGEVSVKWKTIDGTAKSPEDYQGGEGTLTFKHGEMVRTIEIPIVDDLQPEKDECFEIELYEPEGGASLGRIHRIAITISNDDDFNSVMQRMMVMTTHNLKSMEVHHETWKTQFEYALTVNGGDVENATSFDYFMHFLTFGWKVLFSLIPPPGYCGGWLCFFCSLTAIGLLTAVVGDLASIFGCLIGLKDTVTAITFVALGTSLPDLFASKTAAAQEKYADNAIGNVTGSNSVNVFLGLGLPWVIAAIYHEAFKGDRFYYPAGSLAFTVLVYTIVATIAIALLLVRRYVGIFGKAELGGPTGPKYFSGVFLVTLWFIYVCLSTLQSYGYISLL